MWLSKETIFSELSLDKNDYKWKENLKSKFEETSNAQAHFFEITVEILLKPLITSLSQKENNKNFLQNKKGCPKSLKIAFAS